MKNKNRIKVHLSIPSAVFIALMIACDRSGSALITLAAAVLHELGHISAAALCGVAIDSLTLYPFGADIGLVPSLRSYGKDIIIASAGAAANFIAALASLFVGGGEEVSFFIVCNLTLAGINLLPVKSLDGGELLHCMICRLSGLEAAEKIIMITSFFSVFAMWLGSVYIFFVADGSPSLFIIAVFLFSTVFLPRGHREKNED